MHWLQLGFPERKGIRWEEGGGEERKYGEEGWFGERRKGGSHRVREVRIERMFL